MRKNIVVITGGPGFGKTSLIEALLKRGFSVGDEVARKIISEQKQQERDLLPWKNRKAFQQTVLEERIRFWQTVDQSSWTFADRGLPDMLAFADFRGFNPSSLLINQVKECLYFSVVFICPPWKEIYKNDDIRYESIAEACRLHEGICRIYRELGYELVILP